MFGSSLSAEVEVKVSAGEAWKVYGTLKLGEIVQQSLPHIINKIDVVEGDGGVGTVLELFFPPGTMGDLKSYKEKFTVVDDEKRVKVTEVVEGGYLELGFSLYRVRLEVIEKDGKENECVTRTVIEYEANEEAKAALVSIDPLLHIMQMVADHLVKNRTN